MAVNNPGEPRYLSVEHLEADLLSESDGFLFFKSTTRYMAQRLDVTNETHDWINGDMACIFQLRHPSILRCIQILKAPSYIYVITDRYPLTLEIFIRRSQKEHTSLHPIHVLSLMYQLADALTYIHSFSRPDPSAIVLYSAFHGNLSVSTIVLSEDTWHCSLTHPGLHGFSSGMDLHRRDEPFTPYTAPEVRSSGYYSSMSDMWSLGVVFYELLTGHTLQTLEVRTMEREMRKAVMDKKIDAMIIGIVMEQLLVTNPQRRVMARILINELRMLLEKTHEETIRTELFKNSMLKRDSFKIIFENIKEYTTRYMPNAEMSKRKSPCTQYAELASVLPSELLILLRDMLDEEEDDVTTLMRAAENGDAALVFICAPFQAGRLTVRAEQINGWGLRGRTALMGAALRGHFEVAQILIPYEAGMQQHYDGSTALMMAAFMGHTKIVELLLRYENGKRDACGCTALTFAALKNRSDVVSLLKKYETEEPSIC